MSKKDKSLREKNAMHPESIEREAEEVRLKIGASSDSEVIRRAYKLYKKLTEREESSEPLTGSSGSTT